MYTVQGRESANVAYVKQHHVDLNKNQNSVECYKRCRQSTCIGDDVVTNFNYCVSRFLGFPSPNLRCQQNPEPGQKLPQDKNKSFPEAENQKTRSHTPRSRERSEKRIVITVDTVTIMSLAVKLSVFFLLLPYVTLSTTNGVGNDTESAYELLQDFNFPMGLLPKGATGYELDSSTGNFRAFFSGSCSFSLEGSYELRYKSTISGQISENKLTSLTGVSVKILFLWLNIVEVTRSGDDLEFSVGIASASFPIENFYECPQCGCGLNCVNGPVRKLKINPSVSSI